MTEWAMPNYKLQRTVEHRGRTVRAMDGASRGPVRKRIVAAAEQVR
jgi:hypothetical protein